MDIDEMVRRSSRTIIREVPLSTEEREMKEVTGEMI
jgi:hypothetical protein